MHIRVENEEDFDKIRKVNLEAFETDAEANLVDALRRSEAKLISLVAENEGEVIGHILFSPVSADDQKGIKIAGLAPMAVAPKWQNRGTGSKLVKKGIEACKKSGYHAIVVLGHPEYYPRFGFQPATDFDLDSEYKVPKEVFLAMELKKSALASIAGTIKYHPVFKEL